MADEEFLEGALEEEEEDDKEEESSVVEAETIEVSEGQDIIRPVTDDFKEIREVYDRFEEIKKDLLVSEDRQTISGSVFVTKSGWRKIATAFNIDIKTLEEEKIESDDGILRWKAKAEATAPNGVSATGVGLAASNESNFLEKLQKKENKEQTRQDIAVIYDLELENVVYVDGAFRRVKSPREVKEHNIITLASTRAKNRAISDLVGGGEVSSEEMTAEDFI